MTALDQLAPAAHSCQKETWLGISTIILSAPDWSIWKADTLWMVVENELMAFDSAQNEMVYRWP